MDVVVIGAGQAGLAMGHYLARQGRRFVIVDRAESVGAAWRGRWDSLTLFTPRRYSSLPGLPFPGDPDGYPARDEVVAYLERYAETFELPIAFNTDVRRLRLQDDRFVLETDGGSITADHVVVATGPFQRPYVPEIGSRLDVFQTHSSDYRRPGDVPGDSVLVVGGGNTGFQLAKELSASRRVVLSVRSRQTPLPQRFLGRDLFWWLTKTRVFRTTVESRLGRRLRHRDTLIGSSPRELRRRHGVELMPRAVDAAGRSVRFADGTEVEVDAVVWATGYRADHSWIDLPVFDADGEVVHERGITDVPGLSFLGLTWQHTRGSALLGWVKEDAEFIARQIGELPEAVAPQVVELSDGDTYDVEIAAVRKRIGDATLRMLAYNGSIPGPVIKVRQGSTVQVRVTNRGDVEATVHWHGLRLENRFDGTHDTQAPIAVGETFTYQVHAPDPGAYWYHPHIREDYGQEMGLYGNLVVEPSEPDHWPPVHRELALTLDDILIEDGAVAPFSRTETTHVAMGRFGNMMLVNGEPDLALDAKRGEVVRIYLTNTANTRVFNVALPGARMKRVGGDSGHQEHEELVETALLAPSERVVLDVLFPEAGELTFEHRTPDRTYPLAGITVADDAATPALPFDVLRTNAGLVAERERLEPYLDAMPDKTLAFVGEMDMGDHHHDHGHVHVAPLSIEWEDDMAEHNRMTTPATMRWKLVDRDTGAENAGIDWRFRVGARVKIRLVNEMDSDHPMPHPFHVHGAGRFLVLSRDGEVEANLVWKDTVLVRTGETVDILLEVTNPGTWMAHCHIAEHHEGGMMLSFEVT